MKRLIVGATMCMFLSGCIPVAVGMGIWAGAKDSKDKKEFVENFNQQNIEREKAGLEPLNFCTEAIRYNPSWAYKKAECKALKPKSANQPAKGKRGKS